VKCARCGSELPESRLAACPVCLLSGDGDEPHEEPRRLGNLELLEEIGRGGMGTVWRARHRTLGRTVAVKLLPEQLAREPEFRARFEREAKALALLDHPNIVRVHDHGQQDERSFIVLELVEGRTLAEAIPLDVARALEVASQLLDALSYAHKRGVVHRDVKPQNILLDAEGRVKVTDFGIARIVQGAETDWRVTASNVAVGTPGYLAPEALRGAPPDPRRDVYAAGVVLYEAATGKLPIGSFAPPPAALEPIVRRALAPDPEKRYATADEMRADIDRARSGLRGQRGQAPGELPADERAWMRALAVVHAIAGVAFLKAILECMTPKVTPDVPPLVIGLAERCAQGWISYARFETGWVLGAFATLLPSFTGYGILRRHWRLSGLEQDTPERPVPEAGWVLGSGLVVIAVYLLRLAVEQTSHGRLASTLAPALGGVLELVTVYFVSLTILEAWRTNRSLAREWRAQLGLLLALIPPATHYLLYVRDWKPT
jgi:serine/threonine-protein kinase